MSAVQLYHGDVDLNGGVKYIKSREHPSTFTQSTNENATAKYIKPGKKISEHLSRTLNSSNQKNTLCTFVHTADENIGVKHFK